MTVFPPTNEERIAVLERIVLAASDYPATPE